MNWIREDYKRGLVITTYNRPEYLKQCLESVSKADTSFTYVLIVDDASQPETLKIIEKARVDNCILKPTRNGVASSLEIGFTFLAAIGCEILINLDSDAIVAPNFIQKLSAMVTLNATGISSGFNTLTCDPHTKKPRHPIKRQLPNYIIKHSIGGINMAMKPEVFYSIVLPNLRKKGGHWDWNVCKEMQSKGRVFTVTTPSVVQHIGIEDGLNKLNPDISHDYEALSTQRR